MPRILRTDRAEFDLVEILFYLRTHRPSSADRFERMIEKRCQILAQFPEMGHPREELAAGLRSFSVGNYILFYRPVEEGIEIIRVIHGARDIPTLFD